MIPMQYALRRRMMVSAGGSKDMASLAPASGITYTSGLTGLTAAEVSAMSALISNEPTITKDAQTVYIDYGKIHRKLDVANQVTLSVNGTNYAFDIIGFNHDTLTTATAYGTSTATGKAGITFQMHDLLATAYKMNSYYSSSGGWNKCQMRTSTMVTMKGYLPSAWQSIIKPVNKLSGLGGDTTSGTQTTSDSCFLLSELEILGYGHYTGYDEGFQYAYYKAGNSKAKRRNGSAKSWWERSHVSGLSGCFCIIDSSGKPQYAQSHTEQGVSFAFCV